MLFGAAILRTTDLVVGTCCHRGIEKFPLLRPVLAAIARCARALAPVAALWAASFTTPLRAGCLTGDTRADGYIPDFWGDRRGRFYPHLAIAARDEAGIA